MFWQNSGQAIILPRTFKNFTLGMISLTFLGRISRKRLSRVFKKRKMTIVGVLLVVARDGISMLKSINNGHEAGFVCEIAKIRMKNS